MKNKSIVVSVLAIVIGVSIYFVVMASIPPLPALVEQPILFNHKRHQEKDVECYDCHQFYKKYAVAGIPDTELCYSCHKSDKDLQDKEEKRKLHNYFTNKIEIEWQRLNLPLPDDVVFNHKRHVVKDMECAECHGKVEELVETKRLVQDFTMDWCIDCHHREAADEDCLTCHK
ncbi:MAG: cytochrome c3 family protein [Deltaproteobacteria bacterium]|nr:cytochrome c3 family protein [Deltaproteobacteria bacterium]